MAKAKKTITVEFIRKLNGRVKSFVQQVLQSGENEPHTVSDWKDILEVSTVGHVVADMRRVLDEVNDEDYGADSEVLKIAKAAQPAYDKILSLYVKKGQRGRQSAELSGEDLAAFMTKAGLMKSV